MKKSIILTAILAVLLTVGWAIVLLKKPETVYVTQVEKVETVIPLEDIPTVKLVEELIGRDDISSERIYTGKGARIQTFEEDMIVTGDSVILVYKEVD